MASDRAIERLCGPHCQVPDERRLDRRQDAELARPRLRDSMAADEGEGGHG